VFMKRLGNYWYVIIRLHGLKTRHINDSVWNILNSKLLKSSKSSVVQQKWKCKWACYNSNWIFD